MKYLNLILNISIIVLFLSCVSSPDSEKNELSSDGENENITEEQLYSGGRFGMGLCFDHKNSWDYTKRF